MSNAMKTMSVGNVSSAFLEVNQVQFYIIVGVRHVSRFYSAIKAKHDEVVHFIMDMNGSMTILRIV